MWVVNTDVDKVQAYRMSDKQRDTSRDFETLGDAGNDVPQALWGDQTTIWVSEDKDDKVYAYNMPPASTDATLSGISVAGKDVAAFDPDDTSYTIHVASTLAEATVTATPTEDYATVAYSGTDADTGTDGHQVALSPGQNAVTVTVTAQDGNTTKTYTVSINRPATITLVSNTAETRTTGGSDGFVADSFTTGANPDGYTISEISVHIQQATTGQTTVVTLRENGSDSLPEKHRGDPDQPELIHRQRTERIHSTGGHNISCQHDLLDLRQRRRKLKQADLQQHTKLRTDRPDRLVNHRRPKVASE